MAREMLVAKAAPMIPTLGIRMRFNIMLEVKAISDFVKMIAALLSAMMICELVDPSDINMGVKHESSRAVEASVNRSPNRRLGRNGLVNSSANDMTAPIFKLSLIYSTRFALQASVLVLLNIAGALVWLASIGAMENTVKIVDAALYMPSA